MLIVEYQSTKLQRWLRIRKYQIGRFFPGLARRTKRGPLACEIGRPVGATPSPVLRKNTFASGMPSFHTAFLQPVLVMQAPRIDVATTGQVPSDAMRWPLSSTLGELTSAFLVPRLECGRPRCYDRVWSKSQARLKKAWFPVSYFLAQLLLILRATYIRVRRSSLGGSGMIWARCLLITGTVTRNFS